MRVPVCRYLAFACTVMVVGSFPAVAVDEREGSADASDSVFRDRLYRDAEGEHRYAVFVPAGDPPAEGWPVVLFLHGAGERGRDGRRPLQVGLGPMLRERQQTFPAVVVFPQCEDLTGPITTAWGPDSPDGRRALAILAAVEQEFPIDPDRRALTGWSMGGYGAWALAGAHPERWSAVLPVSGGGLPAWPAEATDVRIWAIHGAEDSVVPAAQDRQMVDAVRAVGGTPMYTEIAPGGHDVWMAVYDHPAVLEWLLSPAETSIDPATITFAEPSAERLRQITGQQPFVPALTIERALSLRVGNPALRGLSQGLHEAIDSRLLQGHIDDFDETTQVGGRTLQVAFRDLTYESNLARAVVQSLGADRLSIRLDLRDLHLRIGEIRAQAGGFDGSAGPVEIVVGHRDPVPLTLEVRPHAGNGRLELDELRTSFRIPDNNWYVSIPGSIKAEGAWLSEEELRIAITGGLYLRRSQLEQQVLRATPALLDGLVRRFTAEHLGDLVAAMWPIPVYQPRVHVLLDGVACDQQGISATFAVQVAAVDAEQSPVDHTVIKAQGRAAPFLESTDDIRVTMAAEVIEQTSRLLAESGRARIHAVDVPGQPFGRLTSPSILGESIPALQGVLAEDLRAEFVLAEPFSVQPLVRSNGSAPPASLGNVAHVEVGVPRLQMLISRQVRYEPATEKTTMLTVAATTPKWQPYVEIDFHIRQEAVIRIDEDEQREPLLEFLWGPEPDVSGEGRILAAVQEGSRALDTDRLVNEFRESWVDWTTARQAQRAPLSELSLGQTRMVPESVAWFETRLGATFSAPVTRVANQTGRTIRYSIRGPFSPWSDLRELPGGDEHRYQVPYPITVRLAEQSGQPTRRFPPGTRGVLRQGPGGRPVLASEQPHEESAVLPPDEPPMRGAGGRRLNR